MKKDLGIIFGLFFIVVVLLVFGRGFTSAGFLSNTATSSGQTSRMKGNVSLTAKTLSIDAQVVATPSDRKKGLSGRESLPLNHGMLFVFEQKAQYGIWMKDMQFPIDIIWIGEDKRIVDIVFSATVEKGKRDSELTVYKPKEAAKYILEINAGLSRLHELSVGDLVN